jgi:hypothetical protein
MPDSPLRRATLEMEAFVAADGWDQAPRLFALVPTDDLVSKQPELADQLASDSGEITLVEQDGVPADRPLEDLLTEIAWPDSVMGCAAVLERIMLPPEAEAGLPDDPDEMMMAAAAHPDRQEVRLIAAVTRDGAAHSAVRAREPDDAELLEGPELVPGLIEQLRQTLA